jgi:hypothetical protein
MPDQQPEIHKPAAAARSLRATPQRNFQGSTGLGKRLI